MVVCLRVSNEGEQDLLVTSFFRRAVMISKKRITCTLLIGSFFVFANVLADPPDALAQRKSETSYLLLKNGNVLKGTVRAEKERVSVAVDGHSTLFVESKQVSFIGPTLESIYEHQRSGVRQWGTGEHWQMAQWCVQQGLIDRAIEHYEVLKRSASDSPRFKELEHMLRQALLSDETVKQAVHIKKQTTEMSSPTSQESNLNSVVQASSESPRPKSLPKAASPEVRESRNKHEIPGYIRKTFQNSILPVLVSRCGQSGCHGMLGKSDFHIYQPVGEQAALTLARDLDEVLRYIDQDQTQDSPLLAYATQAHGIQRNPSLSHARADERALIERVNFWVKSLALSQKPETNMPAQYPADQATSKPTSNSKSTVTGAPAISSTSRKSRWPGEVEQDRNAKLSKPAKSAAPTEFLSMSELAELEAAIDKFEKQTSGGTQAKKDPFDPEAFNRQFR